MNEKKSVAGKLAAGDIPGWRDFSGLNPPAASFLRASARGMAVPRADAGGANRLADTVPHESDKPGTHPGQGRQQGHRHMAAVTGALRASGRYTPARYFSRAV